MSDFEAGVTEPENSPKFEVGDRVRYVPNPKFAPEMHTVDNVWHRRTERDSIIVGLPDAGRYPDYRLVTVFEPGEETTWSDRDFWFAPAERLTLAGEPEWEYGIHHRTHAAETWGGRTFESEEQARHVIAVGTYYPENWKIVRRQKSADWEEIN